MTEPTKPFQNQNTGNGANHANQHTPAPVASPAPLQEAPAAPGKAVAFQDEDYVTVLRKNWGTAAIPPHTVDSIDRVQFRGGVAKNVRYSTVKAWLAGNPKTDAPPLELYVLPNDATEQDYIRITGHAPFSSQELASMLKASNLTELAQHLSTEEVDRLVASLTTLAKKGH